MAKPRLSEGRIPFQLGIDSGVIPPGTPIIGACAALSQRLKPRSILGQRIKPVAAITLGVRVATLTQRTKPRSTLFMQTKPIASIAQRPC